MILPSLSSAELAALETFDAAEADLEALTDAGREIPRLVAEVHRLQRANANEALRVGRAVVSLAKTCTDLRLNLRDGRLRITSETRLRGGGKHSAAIEVPLAVDPDGLDAVALLTGLAVEIERKVGPEP